MLVGNAVLSSGSRRQFFDAASTAAALVAGDFAAVLRPSAGGDGGGGGGEWPSLFHAAAHSATPAAPAAGGVDVLLTPCAPTSPWVAADTAALPPTAVYLNDVMTLPASLAGLPAASVPVGYAPYPAAALARAAEAARAAATAATAAEGGLRVPVGLQVIGRHGDEATVLRVAAALEAGAAFRLPSWFSD